MFASPVDSHHDRTLVGCVFLLVCRVFRSSAGEAEGMVHMVFVAMVIQSRCEVKTNNGCRMVGVRRWMA